MRHGKDIKIDEDKIVKMFESELEIKSLVSKTNPHILTAENQFINI